MYRAVFENKVTMQELKTCITINDLFDINDLLDMRSDIENYYNENAERESKRK